MARRNRKLGEAKKLDKAVRKIEGREGEQDSRRKKSGKPVRSTGRTIRDGWKGGA